MGKKRGDRGKEKAGADSGCNLDGDYTSPIQGPTSLSFATVKDTLIHSRYAQILLSLTIIGLFLRLYNLGYNSLWLDEASTLTFATMSIPGIWEATTGGEFNPPLFYWIEHGMLVFGNNEFVLRIIPAVFGILTIPLVYLAGKAFLDRNTGIIAAAAVTFSPFLIFYSQEARAYSMGLFLVVIAMIFFLRALKSGEILPWAFFGLASALAFWTHFYTIVITGAMGLYALAVKIPDIKKDLTAFKPLVLAGVVFAIISLPLIIVTIQLFARRTAAAPVFGIEGVGIITETFRQLSGFSDAVMYLFLILFCIGIVQAFLIDKHKGILLLSLTLLPFAISWFLSYRLPMMPRYLIILAPVYFIGIALAYKPLCTLMKNRLVVYGFIALLIILSVTTPFFMSYYSSFSKEDWRGFSGQVSQITQPGDLVVVSPGYMFQPLDYYYSNATDRTIELGAYTGPELETILQQKGNASLYLVVTGDISAANPEGDVIAWINEHAELISEHTGIYLFAVR